MRALRTEYLTADARYGYRDDNLERGACLCAVDLQQTATLHGYVLQSREDRGAFRWILCRPARGDCAEST